MITKKNFKNFCNSQILLSLPLQQLKINGSGKQLFETIPRFT
jgi:hypothetical protein